MAKRQKQWAKLKRLQLILEMGAQCRFCGNQNISALEFDHINNRRDWIASQKEPSQRIILYRRDWEQGNLQLLCKWCHKDKAQLQLFHQATFQPAECPF